MLHLYGNAFSYFRMGYALAVLFFVLIFGLFGLTLFVYRTSDP